MPDHCAYCYGRPQQDLVLRARRELSRISGGATVTVMEERFAVDVPYCDRHAAISARTRKEIRYLGFGSAAVLAIATFLAIMILVDAPLGFRFIVACFAAAAAAALAILGVGLLVRHVPRYRDWGAGMLGVDLAAGEEALTFRFTNPTFAAEFRTRNGLAR